MHKRQYENPEHAGERRIREAAEIARRARHERRDYRQREREAVEGLLARAECDLFLSAIPRDPAELLEFARRRAGSPTRRPLNDDGGR